MVKEYDPVMQEQADALAAYEFGDAVQMPPPRSHYTIWDESERKRYFKWDSVTIYVPITNKHDIAKYADLLAGLATKLRYIASNPALSDREAVYDQIAEVDETKRKLKRAGGLDKKPSGKNK